jgi:CRP-like cAMP-binding protein
MRHALTIVPQTPPEAGDLPFDASNPFIRKLDALAPLTGLQKALLTEICARPRVVEARTDLICEGEPPGGVFLVLDGFACRYKLRETGARHIAAYLLPGDTCDLDVSLLRRMDHSIGALSPCRVVQIEPGQVEALLAQPGIARALRMSTLVDEATLREWLVNVGARTARERIAHLFCELLVRLQVVGRARADSFDLPLTQQDLAETTGLSNVHVNRSLQELRRQRLIEWRSKHLRILDLPGLKAVAEFKPSYLHLDDQSAA